MYLPIKYWTSTLGALILAGDLVARALVVIQLLNRILFTLLLVLLVVVVDVLTIITALFNFTVSTMPHKQSLKGKTPAGVASLKPIELNGTIYMPTTTVQESREHRSKVTTFADLKLHKYKYDPLESMQRRIRLLRLEGGGTENPEIVCEMFEAQFTPGGIIKLLDKDEELNYEALSWCWGTEGKEYGIRVKKGKDRVYRLAVSRGLALALKYLRRKGRERILWIDALWCVHLANDLPFPPTRGENIILT